MTEPQFQAAVLDLCRLLRVEAYHTHDSRRSRAGFPDLVLWGPGGVLFRELKTAAGRLTQAQKDTLETLRMAGQDARVWRPRDLHDVIPTELRRLTRWP